MNRFVILAFMSLVAIVTSGCATTDSLHGEVLPGYARALAWSPDSRQIVGIRQFDLVVHDSSTLKPLVTNKPSETPFTLHVPTASIALSPDGKTFATAGFDGSVMLWDAQTWLKKSRLKNTEGATTLAFTPDGSQLIVAGPDSALMFFDVNSREKLMTIVDAPSGIMSVAVSPDGTRLATGEMNQQVRIWKLPSKELSATVTGYAGPVLSVAYSPDGRLLASFAGGRDARVLNIDEPNNSITLIDPSKPTAEQHSAEAIVSIVSIVGMARAIQLTGAPSGAPIMGFSYPQWPAFNCPIAFSPDGRLLALIRFSHELSSSYHVEVYDVASGARVSRYDGGISSLAFSPDGSRLAVSGIIRVILLDPLTGQDISHPLDQPWTLNQ